MFHASSALFGHRRTVHLPTPSPSPYHPPSSARLAYRTQVFCSFFIKHRFFALRLLDVENFCAVFKFKRKIFLQKNNVYLCRVKIKKKNNSPLIKSKLLSFITQFMRVIFFLCLESLVCRTFFLGINLNKLKTK